MTARFFAKGEDMAQYRHMIQCFLCKRQFRFGADIYEGDRVRLGYYGLPPLP